MIDSRLTIKYDVFAPSSTARNQIFDLLTVPVTMQCGGILYLVAKVSGWFSFFTLCYLGKSFTMQILVFEENCGEIYW